MMKQLAPASEPLKPFERSRIVLAINQLADFQKMDAPQQIRVLKAVAGHTAHLYAQVLRLELAAYPVFDGDENDAVDGRARIKHLEGKLKDSEGHVGYWKRQYEGLKDAVQRGEKIDFGIPTSADPSPRSSKPDPLEGIIPPAEGSAS